MERPITFSTEMVRAILDGRKTQTRQTRGLEDVNNYSGNLSGTFGTIKLGYHGLLSSDFYLKDKEKKKYAKNPGLYHLFIGDKGLNEINLIPIKCPYGQPGDRLWVRESWWMDEDDQPIIFYAATDQQSNIPLYSPINMPRWASRITLEIVNVRVERVQNINQDDIESEGLWYFSKEFRDEICIWRDCVSAIRNTRTKYYKEFWNSLNGKKHPWDSNPWVWVIEFKKIKE